MKSGQACPFISTGVCLTHYSLPFSIPLQFIRNRWGTQIYEKALGPVYNFIFETHWKQARYVVYGSGVILFLVVVIMDAVEEPERLISLAGLFGFVFLCWCMSTDRSAINWRCVIWGFVLQFVLGFLVLRTDPGFRSFEFVGDQVTKFFDHTKAGSDMVFGKTTVFAFAVLPTIIFFSAFISIMYHWGVVQVMVKKISWLMQRTMGTSAGESLSAAANIFVGQSEAPLLLKPLIPTMTMSEIHAIMTGGFATVAGSVLAAFISWDISASHLISASVMSAPAALAVSKLVYPETEESATAAGAEIVIEKSDCVNFVEAAVRGASDSIGLVANVGAMLIAFLGLLSFVNAILAMLGGWVGLPGLSFALICSYLFVPFALMMGVQPKDCQAVAQLLGTKMFVNEFVAYMELSVFIKARMGAKGYEGMPTISERSEILTTYALCGFANVGSIGIQIAGLASIAPTRRTDVAKIATRAMLSGTLLSLSLSVFSFRFLALRFSD